MHDLNIYNERKTETENEKKREADKEIHRNRKRQRMKKRKRQTDTQKQRKRERKERMERERRRERREYTSQLTFPSVMAPVIMGANTPAKAPTAFVIPSSVPAKLGAMSWCEQRKPQLALPPRPTERHSTTTASTGSQFTKHMITRLIIAP